MRPEPLPGNCASANLIGIVGSSTTSSNTVAAANLAHAVRARGSVRQGPSIVPEHGFASRGLANPD
jgi:hypothetical protein